MVNEKNVLMTTDEGPDFIWNVSCVVPVLAVSRLLQSSWNAQ